MGLCLPQVGSDMAAGEVVLRAGHFIGAAEVGILATVGATSVQVGRKAGWGRAGRLTRLLLHLCPRQPHSGVLHTSSTWC